MSRHGPTLGVDFGTSNSAAGLMSNGKPHLIALAPGQTTLPSTVFFDFETRETLMGEAASRALLDGTEGRFMRALKRVLGTSLMHERRPLLNERLTFVEIIGRFLAHIKARAEAETGQRFERVLSGRPVFFHAAGDRREAQAEDDLRACYEAAGFRDIRFMPEPEAAAIAGGALEREGDIGLIVDIGGGTSDFSIFRSEGAGVRILANNGIRVGGTDFDRSLSLAAVMPLLGKGSDLRKLFGPGTTPVPATLFNDLATWETIPFVYTPQNLRTAREMAQLACEPGKLARLVSVIDHELGHELAFAVERGKIAVNVRGTETDIDLDVIETGLAAPLAAHAMAASLRPLADRIGLGVDETLERAGLTPDRVAQVVYVGGSSLMSIVSTTLHQRFPDARHTFSEVFTAVADGLAIAAGRD